MTYDQLVQATRDLGFPIAIGLGFFVVMAWALRRLINALVGSISTRIDAAVTYFTSKLDTIAARQEMALDKLDSRMESMSERQAVATERLADALREQTAALGGLSEANRSLMIFVSQNMAQLAAHRQAVEGPDGPSTGVVKPIEPKEA